MHFATAQGLQMAAFCKRGTTHFLPAPQGLQAPHAALQGLHGLHFAAAQGLHGLYFAAAQGLHLAAAQGLHLAAAQGLHFLGAHWAKAGLMLTPSVTTPPTMATPAKTTNGTIVVDKSILFLDSIDFPPGPGPRLPTDPVLALDPKFRLREQECNLDAESGACGIKVPHVFVMRRRARRSTPRVHPAAPPSDRMAGGPAPSLPLS
ncbi:MAG: hypothetical protein IIA68_04465 [Proteobacteria bacterium]|nr:hypothetical protein [Pseudomonadota bacterium]